MQRSKKKGSHTFVSSQEVAREMNFKPKSRDEGDQRTSSHSRENEDEGKKGEEEGVKKV